MGPCYLINELKAELLQIPNNLWAGLSSLASGYTVWLCTDLFTGNVSIKAYLLAIFAVLSTPDRVPPLPASVSFGFTTPFSLTLFSLAMFFTGWLKKANLLSLTSSAIGSALGCCIVSVLLLPSVWPSPCSTELTVWPWSEVCCPVTEASAVACSILPTDSSIYPEIHSLSIVMRNLRILESCGLKSFKYACAAIKWDKRAAPLPEASCSPLYCVTEQRRLWWDCMNAKVHLSLHCSPMWQVPFKHGLAHLSCDTTNPTKWHVRPAKTQINLGIPPVWSVFAVCMKKAWILSYLLSTQRRLWSGWADSQADPSLCWMHMPFCWFCALKILHSTVKDLEIKRNRLIIL